MRVPVHRCHLHQVPYVQHKLQEQGLPEVGYVRGYATSINVLFKLQDIKPPADMADPNNILGIPINNLVKEEDIAR
jgi:hypothetical protein